MSFVELSRCFSEIYQGKLPEFFDKEVPPEPFSNCADCPMVYSHDEKVENLSKPFSSETKCCTFHPRLPAYLVGAVLSDDAPELITGKQRMIEKIDSRRGIFPHGVYPTKKYRLLYDVSKIDAFGRSKNLICPFFISGSGSCSIWKYRESICGLWFCNHIGYHTGHKFWQSMIDYFKIVQEKLTLYCFGKLGVEPPDPYGTDELLTYEDVEELPMNSKQYAALWGEWEGREVEFFRESYHLVKNLDKQYFQRITGQDGSNLLTEVIKSYQQFIDIPVILKKNQEYFRNPAINNFYSLEIKNYISRIDATLTFAFKLPSCVPDAFDGLRSTAEAVEYVRKNHNIKIEDEIIIALYHHGVLISVS